MDPRRPLRSEQFVLALAVALAASACSEPSPLAPCRSSDECAASEVCVDGRCGAGPDAGPRPDGASPSTDAGADTGPEGACRGDSECPGGRCIGGLCCGSDQLCGSACCGASEVCFAGACVTPLDACRTTADCAEQQYCEPALGGGGEGDGGVAMPMDAGRACTASEPRAGRCLAVPPRCADGGGMEDGGVGCTATCEYRPEVARLQAEVAWDWGQAAPPTEQPEHVDVWSTPAVGRLYDANCDGSVDELDPPDVVFVSGRAIDVATGQGTCCHCTGASVSACLSGVLRVVDGRTGAEVWSLRRAGPMSIGFSGISVALGDLDGDGRMNVAAVTGEGSVVILEGDGTVLRTSDQPIPGASISTFGWGGGLAIADMEGDGFPEIAFGATVFTTEAGALTRRFVGTGGIGGDSVASALSTFADLDGAADLHLELLAGRTAYRADGTTLWDRADLSDGFSGIANFVGDAAPEVVLVSRGTVLLLSASTGATLAGPFRLGGTGAGGPPTIADFDGDGAPEIGIAQQNYYSVLEVVPDGTALREFWRTANHDLSSSVTGSTVFDFEGDGIAEVVYADECFLWVYDGPTGHVRYAGLTTSFTGTEASVVADVDGDGHAEIVLVSNGADPTRWRCNLPEWTAPNTDPDYARPGWSPPPGATAYRGVRVLRDAARSWVGTRPIWNQHTYHVTNVCVPGDSACADGATYGSIPRQEASNWSLGWLNNFRQNVQQAGIFDAADATLVLEVQCTTPVELVISVRNQGAAILPPGVRVDYSAVEGGVEVPLGTATTTGPVFPGAVEQLRVSLPADRDPMGVFRARIVNPSDAPTFRQCRDDNDQSADVTASCIL